MERDVSAQNFVYHHPERITIRGSRPWNSIEAERGWIDQFWTHPAAITTLLERGRGARGAEQTKIREAGATVIVD